MTQGDPKLPGDPAPQHQGTFPGCLVRGSLTQRERPEGEGTSPEKKGFSQDKGSRLFPAAPGRQDVGLGLVGAHEGLCPDVCHPV